MAVKGVVYQQAKCRQSALKERGIDKMLEEAREDHKENDAAHLRRKCECLWEDNKIARIMTDQQIEIWHVLEDLYTNSGMDGVRREAFLRDSALAQKEGNFFRQSCPATFHGLVRYPGHLIHRSQVQTKCPSVLSY